MMLVERDGQLAVLGGLLEDALAGRGRVALVSGAVGVGKSALIHAFADRAAASGATILAANGSAQEGGIPLGVVSQLFDTTAVAEVTRRELRQLMRADPDEPATLRDVTLAMLDLAAEVPLVLVVDDAHHADAASLSCLTNLVRRLRDRRVLVVFGYRDPPAHAELEFRVEIGHQPYARAIPLRLLSPEGVTRLVIDRLGEQEGQRIAAECVEISAGSPLLLDAIIADHAAARTDIPAPAVAAGPVVTAEGYQLSVVTCLRRGWPVAADVARALATLGSPRDIDRLLELDAMTVAAATAALGAAGLVTSDGFRHPRTSAAVLSDVTPDRRIELHRRAANLAYASGQAPTVVARHLIAANSAETRWGIPILTAAAASALAVGQVGAAVDYLRLACDVCDDDGERARITTTLMRAQWRMNPSAPEGCLADLRDAMFSGHLRGSDAVVLSKALLWHGRFEEARDVLIHLGTADAPFDAETNAELRMTRPWMRCFYAPILPYVPDAVTGGGPATTENSRRFDAVAALDAVLTSGPSAQVVAEAERILRSTRLEGMGMDAVESALLTLTYADCGDRAVPWCDGLIGEAEARQAPSRHARLAAIRSEIAIRQGDLPGAERHARQALDVMPAGSWGVAVGTSLASLVNALTAMGRPEEAAQALNLPVPAQMLQTQFGLHYLHARGRYNLTSGDFDGALADFRSCGDLMGRWNLDVPGLIAWRNDAAETLLRMGERDQARELIEDQISRGDRRTSPRAYGSSLRLLARTHDVHQRPALLRQAAQVLHASKDEYELARALTDLTETYHELGESRRARVLGRQAWTVAARCGAEPLRRVLAARSGQRPGLPDSSAVVLSDAEQRVADLVVLGHTNREIGKRLFVTVSTVEQHLTRVYRKLGVASRAELSSALPADASASSRPETSMDYDDVLVGER